MKTLSIFLFALLITLTGYSQQLINQKDAFTGKQVKGATVTLGNSFTSIGQMIVFAENDGKKYISLCWMPGVTSLNIGNVTFDNIDVKKCSLLFKMDNDSIFKFSADTLLSKKGGTGQTAMLNVGAVVTDDQLKFLMTHKISIIRLGLTSDNVGVDAPVFTSKNQKQVQTAAAFMLDMKLDN